MDMTKATNLAQFEMLAEEAADYTDTASSQVLETVRKEAGYVHRQGYAAAQWNVTHALGRYPAVTVVDSAGSVVIGDVRYTGINSVVISFSAPFSGTAYLS